jgi:hypothetical protein
MPLCDRRHIPVQREKVNCRYAAISARLRHVVEFDGIVPRSDVLIQRSFS